MSSPSSPIARRIWLDAETSSRVSAHLRAFHEKRHCSAVTLANDAGGIIHPKTLLAMLAENAGRRWERRTARALVRHAALTNFLSPRKVWNALMRGHSSLVPWVDEMPALTYWHLSHRSAKKLARELARHERAARCHRTFARVPLDGLMPDEMMKACVAGMYGLHLPRRSRILAGIRRLERERHEALFESPELPTLVRQVFTPQRDFIQMLRRFPPFHLCERDSIEQYIELLVRDAIEQRGVNFGLIDPLVIPHRADQWLLTFAAVTAVDDRLLVRRQYKVPYVMTTVRSEDQLANAALDLRVSMFDVLPSRLVHTPGKRGVVEVIEKLVRRNLR